MQSLAVVFRASRRRLSTLALALGLAACGESAPELGAIRFVAHVDGAAPDVDPDGFQVAGVLGAATIPVPIGEPVTVGALPAAEYAVALGDIAPNCSAVNGPDRSITVVPDDTVSVVWSVTCGFRPASLTVGFVTPADAAAGSIEISLGDAPPIRLQPGEEVTFEDLAPGPYPLSVGGMPPNCRVQDQLSSTVHLVSGASSSFTFHGACSSGRIVFDVGGRLWQVNSDGSGLSEVTALGAVNAATPSVTLDGSRIAFTESYGSLTLMDWDASNLSPLVSMGSLQEPAWSPDGSRIAFNGIDAETGTWDIYVIDRDGSNLRNITNSPHQEHRPAWTRDGSRILFSAAVDGSEVMYSINPDGTGREPLGAGANPVQSPTAGTVAFYGGGMLRIMDPDGQNVRDVPGSYNFSGSLAWSPDGRLLIFFAGALPQNGIAAVDLNGQVSLIVPSFGAMDFPTVSWGR